VSPSASGSLPQIKRIWREARDIAIELAAGAAITREAKLGTLVTPPFFRNPAILAKQVATIDHVADGGRVIAGLGAGWFQAEFDGTN
jgi:alkanesulfonate monooxygenase SsuD/methylene tetrahydromethanopterin reductase-like flavin-dependent oxidoreductase (luciferase family)